MLVVDLQSLPLWVKSEPFAPDGDWKVSAGLELDGSGEGWWAVLKKAQGALRSGNQIAAR
jgi:hypothetical protein